MLYVMNDYIKIDDVTTTLRASSKAYTVECLVPTGLVSDIAKFVWCLDQEKGQLYSTDAKRTIVDTLGLKGTRLFLWKYVLFLHTGKIHRFWNRKDLSNYLPTHGQYVQS